MAQTRSEPLVELTGEASVVIQAPVELVYAALADFTRHSSWNKNIYKIWQITPGPVAVGTRFRAMEGAPPAALGRQLRALGHIMAGMLGGAKPLSEAEITALEPGRRIDWVGIFPGRHGEFNRAEWQVELMPSDGGTRLVQRLPGNAVATSMIAPALLE